MALEAAIGLVILAAAIGAIRRLPRRSAGFLVAALLLLSLGEGAALLNEAISPLAAAPRARFDPARAVVGAAGRQQRPGGRGGARRGRDRELAGPLGEPAAALGLGPAPAPARPVPAAPRPGVGAISMLMLRPSCIGLGSTEAKVARCRREALQQRPAPLGMGLLAAAKHDRHLDLVAPAKEALDVAPLGLVVVVWRSSAAA